MADWLVLSAAPSFAMMALVTGVRGGGTTAMICGAAPAPSWLGGMVPMYLLMSAVHAGPWLTLIAKRLDRIVQRVRLVKIMSRLGVTR